MKIVLVASALLLSACGGSTAAPVWHGTFLGTLAQSGTCSDGSTPAATATGDFLITGDAPQFAVKDQCGADTTATASGSTATLQPYACPATTLPGGHNSALAVSGGTFTAGDGTLDADLTGTLTLTGTDGATTATCTVHLTGRLGRIVPL